MSTWATIVVTKANKSAAQALTSSNHFTNEVKKTLSRYFVSSGLFSDEHYNALTNSDLVYHIETNQDVRPTQTLSSLGMSRVIED
jgi:hypothetical protein